MNIRIFTVLLLSGCGVLMSHTEPPQGWPVLKPYLWETTWLDTQQRCGVHPLLLATGGVAGCALIYLDRKECYIVAAVKGAELEALIEHELQHCKGTDHMGSTALSDHLAKWKATRPQLIGATQ